MKLLLNVKFGLLLLALTTFGRVVTARNITSEKELQKIRATYGVFCGGLPACTYIGGGVACNGSFAASLGDTTNSSCQGYVLPLTTEQVQDEINFSVAENHCLKTDNWSSCPWAGKRNTPRMVQDGDRWKVIYTPESR